MIFYDFEVFEKDWLAVFIDVTKKKEHVIINSPDKLKALYEANRKDIWVGFNNRHYDQYIMKGILLGMNPKKINDWIIVDNKEGWQYSRAFNKLPMINYDVMPSNDETMKTVGLKTMEGFLGSNIKETDVDFRIKRKLTPEEIEQTVKYCRHDVEQTIKVFLEKVSEFNAVHGIIQAFPKETSLYDIGDSEARITAKVLGCSKTHFGDEFDFFFLPCLKLKKYKYVQEWFAEKRKEALEMGLQDFDKKDKKTWYKSQNFETVVAGIPHTFGFGGLHGASDKPIHRKGQILHVDVNNYYPSMLIAWGLVTRAATNNNFKLVYDTRKAMKKKQVAAAKVGRKAEAKQWKKAQLPYKKMLNALSGAMKDETNAAYDPRNNNCIGYCFYRRNELGKAFILTGDKSNGKSTFLDCVKAVVGEENISALDLKELGDRFSTSMMFGKLANIGDDIGDDFLQGSQVATFKKVVTGNRIKAERKGQDPFEFNPYVKLLFSANDIPRMKDKTGAVLRRLVIIPFNARFTKYLPSGEIDPDYNPYIKYQLVEQSSVEYLIRVGVEGLKRIIENNEFTKSEKVAEQIDEYENENNPIKAFIDECGVEMIEDEPTGDVYSRYQVFCADCGMQPMSNIVFSKQINKRLGFETVVTKVGGKSIRIFRKV